MKQKIDKEKLEKELDAAIRSGKNVSIAMNKKTIEWIEENYPIDTIKEERGLFGFGLYPSVSIVECSWIDDYDWVFYSRDNVWCDFGKDLGNVFIHWDAGKNQIVEVSEDITKIMSD